MLKTILHWSCCWGPAVITHLFFAAVFFEEIHAAELRVPAEHQTISLAVSAAKSGDTIRLAKGDYYEQFVIVGLTNVTVLGEAGAILHANEVMEQTLLPYDGVAFTIAGVVRGADVTFRNLEFDGHRLADNYPTALSAVVFRGSSGRIENCTLHGFRGIFDKRTQAVNVENHLSDGSRIRNIGVLTSTFSDNKSSIQLWGAAEDPNLVRVRFTLEGNTFVGAQPAADVVSGGVGIRFGVEGVVKGNTVTDHSADLGMVLNDGLFKERGYFYPTKRVVFSGNNFSNNAVHLATIAGTGTVITNNVFERKASDVREWGVSITGTDILVADNNFAVMPLGIALPANELLEGVSRGGARNIKLLNNWFRDVPIAVSTNSAVKGLEESGTKLSDFAPSFETLSLFEDGKVRAHVRSWHREPNMIESSTELKQWIPLRTSMPALPISELELSDAALNPSAFFRLRIDR